MTTRLWLIDLKPTTKEYCFILLSYRNVFLDIGHRNRFPVSNNNKTWQRVTYRCVCSFGL